MSDPVRVGLIGTGGISRRAHVPAWRGLDGAEVVAIAEPVDERRADARSMLGGDVAAYGGYEELLADAEPDLVDVTIRPGETKRDAIRTALEGSVDVTCQKPFAESVDAAADLVDTAEKEDRLLSVNQQARYAGAFARGREYVESGRLGDLRTIGLRSEFALDGEKQWLYYGVHSVDLARFWAGREPERVMAWYPRQTADAHLLAAWLDFGDGLAAGLWDEFAASTTLRWAYRLMGSDGAVRGHEAFTDGMFPPRVAYAPAGEAGETIEPIGSRYVPDAFAAYFADVVGAVRGEHPPPTPGADNLRTLRAAVAVREAAERGEWVEVPHA